MTDPGRAPPAIENRTAPPPRSGGLRPLAARIPNGPPPPPLPPETLSGPRRARLPLSERVAPTRDRERRANSVSQPAPFAPPAPPEPPVVSVAPAHARAPSPPLPHPPPHARGRSALPLAAGLTGFVLGVVFWHLVGFWSFVSAVVFKPPTEPTTQLARSNTSRPNGAPLPSDKPPTTLHGALPSNPAPASLIRCAALRRDRTTGHTVREPCPTSPGIELAEERRQAKGPLTITPRGDLELSRKRPQPAVAGWSATREPTTRQPATGTPGRIARD